MKSRPPIKDTFTVLVVPSHSICENQAAIPTVVYSVHIDGYIPVVAKADAHSVQSSPWALTAAKKRSTIKSLRALADWLESGKSLK